MQPLVVSAPGRGRDRPRPARRRRPAAGHPLVRRRRARPAAARPRLDPAVLGPRGPRPGRDAAARAGPARARRQRPARGPLRRRHRRPRRPDRARRRSGCRAWWSSATAGAPGPRCGSRPRRRSGCSPRSRSTAGRGCRATRRDRASSCASGCAPALRGPARGAARALARRTARALVVRRGRGRAPADLRRRRRRPGARAAAARARTWRSSTTCSTATPRRPARGAVPRLGRRLQPDARPAAALDRAAELLPGRGCSAGTGPSTTSRCSGRPWSAGSSGRRRARLPAPEREGTPRDSLPPVPSPSRRCAGPCSSPRSRAGTTPATPRRRRSSTSRALGRPRGRELDPDEYYDFQVNRPTVQLEDGETRRITWPTTRFSVARLAGEDRDVILVRGLEPNMRWRGFCEELLVDRPAARRRAGRHARRAAGRQPAHPAGAGERHVVRPGGRPSARPRAQPLRGPDRHRRRLPGRLHHAPGSPRCRSGPPCRTTSPSRRARRRRWRCCAGSRTLLDLPVPLGDLPEQARAWERQVDELAAEDTDVAEYIASLEEREPATELPEASGDAIAKEFERYLRRRGDDEAVERPAGRPRAARRRRRARAPERASSSPGRRAPGVDGAQRPRRVEVVGQGRADLGQQGGAAGPAGARPRPSSVASRSSAAGSSRPSTRGRPGSAPSAARAAPPGSMPPPRARRPRPGCRGTCSSSRRRARPCRRARRPSRTARCRRAPRPRRPSARGAGRTRSEPPPCTSRGGAEPVEGDRGALDVPAGTPAAQRDVPGGLAARSARQSRRRASPACPGGQGRRRARRTAPHLRHVQREIAEVLGGRDREVEVVVDRVGRAGVQQLGRPAAAISSIASTAPT